MASTKPMMTSHSEFPQPKLADPPSPPPLAQPQPQPQPQPPPPPPPMPSTSTPACAPSVRNSTPVPENLMHKNRLQEYTQRSCLPIPVYQTVNEGQQHAPKFRSTVFVDGEQYTSVNTFSQRKAAEQEAAKLALENISRKIKDEGCPLIHEDTTFCKSILNEFAVKMNLEMPTYKTMLIQGLVPTFVSSLVFNGVTYTGDTGRTKRESEQLAARAAILGILGNSGSGTMLFEIIKSKTKLFASLNKVKDRSSAEHNSAPVGVKATDGSVISAPKDKEVDAAVVSQNVATSAIPEAASGVHLLAEVCHNLTTSAIPQAASGVHLPVVFNHNPVTSAVSQVASGVHLPHHLFQQPKQQQPSQSLPMVFVPSQSLPMVFVSPVSQQPINRSPTSAKKGRKTKNKANKKPRVDDQSPSGGAFESSPTMCGNAKKIETS